jgi:predicted glycogen debranching enzyme
MPSGSEIILEQEICGNLPSAEACEWWVTNGMGGYASGTVAGLLTRRYHGLLVAALQPPLGRTLLLAKLDETVEYAGSTYNLATNRWADGTVAPQGYRYLQQFHIEGTLPVWCYAWADALLEKRIWMQQGANTTFIQYHLRQGTAPIQLSLTALVNYRDYHSDTQNTDWQMAVHAIPQGVKILSHPQAVPFYLSCDAGTISLAHDWYQNFDLAVERYRGLTDHEHHLHAATFRARLEPGQRLTCIASTESVQSLPPDLVRQHHQTRERELIQLWQAKHPQSDASPAWIQQLVLAADQFIVNRAIPQNSSPQKLNPQNPVGKTILAGYPWFSDWGRDTMISLPGLTLVTGRPDLARSILRTYAQYVDQGMLPNRFPDAGETPEYNTVDATLWFFEAVRQYDTQTHDPAFLAELFPILEDIIDWHCRGTRYNIHRDPLDGLLYAGTPNTQLTWMDAKVGDWVVTPRMGKAVEINALWYNALLTMASFANELGKPHRPYADLATTVGNSFSRFWNPTFGYCYDVLDTPTGLATPPGHDTSLRPNQLFAVSLPHSPLDLAQQKAVVDCCQKWLLTPYGLRSLAPTDPNYQGHYGGNQRQRDGAYHQGTVWGWLLGPFALAHLKVYRQPGQVRQFLEPMAHHLYTHGIGSISEIFEGDAPFTPRGCPAQAWSVAEVLRVWAELAAFVDDKP